MCTNMAIGAAKAVLFIEVSSLQGVLIGKIPLFTDSIYMYMCAQIKAEESSQLTARATLNRI